MLCVRQLAGGHVRQPEIHDLHERSRQHDVVGLDVAVDDAVRMRLPQPFGHLGGHVERLSGAHGTRGNPLVQGGALDMLHDDENRGSDNQVIGTGLQRIE